MIRESTAAACDLRRARPLAELAGVDFGPPLHSLLIVGRTHEVEDEALAAHRLTPHFKKYIEASAPWMAVPAERWMGHTILYS